MRSHPLIRRFLAICCLVSLWAVWWIGWGGWPNPERRELPWTPDVIVVLGGGDQARSREAMRMAEAFPDAPLIVTGDGGSIVGELLAMGVSPSRLIHEQIATSTIENAHQTAPLLDRLHAQKVVLVTNWFHAPRALVTFRHVQPRRDFAASFEPKPESLSTWDRAAQRRERLATVLYWLRYGVCSR